MSKKKTNSPAEKWASVRNGNFKGEETGVITKYKKLFDLKSNDENEN